MQNFTTEGIVLKRKNYSEADRLLTVITPMRGKITVLAKGVRRITSRRAGSVELLNRVKLHLYQGKGLFYILTEAEAVETYLITKNNLVLSAYASHILELVDRMIPENQLNPHVYQLVVTALELLQKHPRKLLIRAFEVKLLSELGFWSHKELDISDHLRELLEILLWSDWKDLVNFQVDSAESIELEQILRYYIEEVLEGPLKSLEVISKINESN